MDIIIGRESGVAEPRLCLKTGNITKYIGAAGSVPRSVSRSHCVITLDEGNNLSIKNVSDQNALYVNGMEYKSKSITDSDLVELGPEKYRLDVTAVIKAFKTPASTPSNNSAPNVKSYNISSLKRVWNDYTQAKLDIQIRNVWGKEDTLITIQIDQLLAEKFGMEYVDRDNTMKTPYIIHRTSMGCYERTLAWLIEKYSGNLPTWLCPEQVRILPISDKVADYAEEVRKELRRNGVDVTVDDSSADYKEQKVYLNEKDGETRTASRVVVDEVEFCGSKKDNAKSTTDDDGFEEILSRVSKRRCIVIV